MSVFDLRKSWLDKVAYGNRVACKNSLRMSPMNFAVDPLAKVIQIPWPMEGAFVMSLVGAHIIGAMLHSNPSRHFHLELAFTGALVKKKHLRDLEALKALFVQEIVAI